MAAEGNHQRQARRRKLTRDKAGPTVQVRRLHRRDLNKVWDFLKRSFRDVNLETVEYQRPRSKKRFFETYEEEGVEQLLFVVDGEIVAYTECTFEIIGSDTWINPRYFEKRDMRPLYVEELAVHPDWHGRGVGSFVLEQIQHLAKVRGLTHLVLEVAENNTHAMQWYRKRGFRKLDASVFMAYAVDVAPELLPPRALENNQGSSGDEGVELVASVGRAAKSDQEPAGKRAAEKRAVEKRAAEKRVAAKRVIVKRVAEEKVVQNKVAAKKAAEKRAVEKKAAANRVVEKRAAEKKAAAAEKRAAEKRAAEKKPEAMRARAPGGLKAERAAAADALAVIGSRGPEPRDAVSDGGNGAREDAKNGQHRTIRVETAPPVATAPESVPGRRRPS